MRTERHNAKRQALSGYAVLGIDPAKANHHGVILDAEGIPQGKSFSFEVSRTGFESVWEKIGHRLRSCGPDDLVVAIEASCNLWCTAASYFHSQGYTVVLVKPLTTYHSRSLMKQDFSRTDPKDAYLVADNAQKGFYDTYHVFEPHIEAMHQLAIAYDKQSKDRSKAKLRLRSFMEKYFPEYLKAFDISTKTSLHLLSRYFLPRHFLDLDIDAEAPQILKISLRYHGRETLEDLKMWAETSIGVPVDPVVEGALRIILDSLISNLSHLEDQVKHTMKALKDLARQLPEFDILTSIPNINEKLAALFIAETANPSRFDHYKQIEKLAGLNLRLAQSGQYAGQRRIGRIGNNRLRHIIYQMTEQTSRAVPQVRCRFLRCQLKRSCYRKSIVSSSAQLLKLIMALLREKRLYSHKSDWNRELKKLEQKYQAQKQKQKQKSPRLHKNSHIRRQALVEKNKAA